MMDMRLYYQEKKIWGDPEAFRPERFINEGGQLVNANSIISFSFGTLNICKYVNFVNAK